MEKRGVKKGYKQTKEHSEKISKGRRGMIFSEEHKSNLSKARKSLYENGYKVWNDGLTKELDERVKNVAELNSLWLRDGEYKQKISNSLKGRFVGENHPNWNNGSSFEPYSPEFNKEKKQFILERDGHTCQNINCLGNSNFLHIHHIDFNKKNSCSDNLILLCNSCHGITTASKTKRDYYINYYQNIMINRIIECLL